jgi:hypothetical protein
MQLGRILVVSCLLTGCTTTKAYRYADFSGVDARLDAAIEEADPKTKKHLTEAKKQLESAVANCKATSEAYEQVVKDKNEALKDVEYWKAKQRKALKEIWIWRGLLIAVGLFALRGPIMWVARKFVGIPF